MGSGDLFDRVATWVSAALSPLIVIALSVSIAAVLTSTRDTLLITTGLTVLLCFVVPISVVMVTLRTVHVGRALDVRVSRVRVLSGLLLWEAFAITMLWLAGVPSSLVAALVGLGGGILALAALTATVGASGHVGVLASISGVAVMSAGWFAASVIFCLASLVAWSRLRLGEHSQRDVWVSLALCSLVGTGVSFAIAVAS